MKIQSNMAVITVLMRPNTKIMVASLKHQLSVFWQLYKQHINI